MKKMTRYSAAVAAAALIPLGLAGAARADDGEVKATLEMEPTKLDFEGSKLAGMFYMPSGAKLSAAKPALVKKEPAYTGTPRYITVKLGNGSPGEFAMAFDETEGKEARVYADLNGDGDLTNDGTGAWQKKEEPEGHSAQYSATFVFDTHWKNADGSKSSGKYGLNFYRSPDRDSVNYYRAGARTGKIKIDSKTYDVFMLENDNDAMFNKLYDPKLGGEVKTKPVWLKLDGDQFDIRGTFSFGESNYLATVSDDGANLTMKPTAKAIRLPRPGAAGGGEGRPELLKVGTEAPDFTVIAWNGAMPAGQEPTQMKLSEFKGKKVVVVDFWATWCGPCMKGLPHLNKIAEGIKGQDVVVLAVNSMDDQAAYERFARGKGKEMSLTLVRDPAGKENDASIAKRLYNVSGIPATYIIGKDGKIAATVSGYTEGDVAVEDALKKLGIKVN